MRPGEQWPPLWSVRSAGGDSRDRDPWNCKNGVKRRFWPGEPDVSSTGAALRLPRTVMAGYQLWSPWTPLDESFQWLRHTTPTPSSKHPFRASPCFPHTPSDLEVQLCFQEVTLVLDSPLLETGVSPKLPCHTSALRTVNNKKGLVRKPQPIRLSGVDSVFGRVITAQPPKWTGTFRVSDKSAFCKIISREHQWPTGLKEPQIQMTVTMCKQMLRSILLLYATYKKCTFALQHSK
ncbi:FANCD2 opposite strand protein isoform X1 [Tupaia chinensis]|nr:FANCD2 opposite strand protein isoform X1 [Tupaia chinensis]